MDESIVALAIEALEGRKEAIQAEIDALKGANPKRPKWSAAARKAQHQRMRAYWATKKGTAKHSKASKPGRPTARKKPGSQSVAAKKAISMRMKAHWAKRKAGRTENSQ